MRVDVGVMPAIRPDAVSNRIRLAYEVRAAVRRFVAEDGAVDSALRLPGALVDAGVDEASPDPAGVSGMGAENELFSWAAKQPSFAAVSVLARGIVALIEGENVSIAIFREPPHRNWLPIHRAPIEFRDLGKRSGA